jgi:hypothetical protein
MPVRYAAVADANSGKMLLKVGDCAYRAMPASTVSVKISRYHWTFGTEYV